MPQVGEPAPEFALPDDAGALHRLADERGKWIVLYFYPADDTPGCTREACEFRDADRPLREAGAVVWGVSPQGQSSKARFRAKYALPFTLLADEDHRVADEYGAWVLKERQGRRSWGVQRATFLIAPDGRVARVWETVRPEGHAAQVLAAIDEERAAIAQ